jgi:cation diffusion facilitator CzcD-associated flavoprotein CzcO
MPGTGFAPPRDRTAATAFGPTHGVAIIGARLSGIGMAIELRRAGLDDFVVARGSEIGGRLRGDTYRWIAGDIAAQADRLPYELKRD